MRDYYSWDAVWMTMADTIAKRSRCDRAQVGAVLVSPDNLVISAGYNAPPHSWWPAATQPQTHCTEWCPRARGESLDSGYADCPAAHAEMNALAQAKESLGNAKLYITTGCCYHCAKVISNTYITRIVARWPERPGYDMKAVRQFLTDCGLSVSEYG